MSVEAPEAKPQLSIPEKVLDLLSDVNPQWATLPSTTDAFVGKPYSVLGFRTTIPLGESTFEVRLEKLEGKTPGHWTQSLFRIKVGKEVEGETVFTQYNFDSMSPAHRKAESLYYDLKEDLVDPARRKNDSIREEIKAEFEEKLTLEISRTSPHS